MSTRLPGAKYKRVFDLGRPVKGRVLAAWRLESSDADRKAGVVVSKKTFHDACRRNRAKRLMRESFRLLEKQGEVPEGTDWVFSARFAIKGKKCPDVMDDMRRVFARG